MAYRFANRVAGEHPMTEPWDQWGIHGAMEADERLILPASRPLLDRYPLTPERAAVILEMVAELEEEFPD